MAKITIYRGLIQRLLGMNPIVNGAGHRSPAPFLVLFYYIYKNLKHFARIILGIAQERIDEAIKLVELEKVLNEKVGRYSLGMRQRLGIAQALLHKPSVLILAEPTNGLNPAGIREIRQYIRKLAVEQKVAVIISSHLLLEIELMCYRIGIIKNGEFVAIQLVKINVPTKEKLLQVEIETDPVEKVFKNIKAKTAAVQADGRITLQLEKEQIPALISKLVEQKVLIYEVNVNKTTLEDKFFDLIGENVIG